jgi:hypothetical protein
VQSDRFSRTQTIHVSGAMHCCIPILDLGSFSSSIRHLTIIVEKFLLTPISAGYRSPQVLQTAKHDLESVGAMSVRLLINCEATSHRGGLTIILAASPKTRIQDKTIGRAFLS